MYTHKEERSVEKICYEKEHIDKNIKLIKEQFDNYFNEFIESENGFTVTRDKLKEAAEDLGIELLDVNENDIKEKYNRIICEAILNFKMNRENLEVYKDAVKYFKDTVLKNECPIIHFTLLNKRAKALDKYRRDFNMAKPEELLKVVTNLNKFAEKYVTIYSKQKDKIISSYEELELDVLDTEEYTAYGVIGGGIKSHMLYKISPEMFANRSREAIWALWYLTDKKVEDCKMDSEFLMIDVEKSITQQNYFYPYSLFSFYALTIFYLLNDKARENNIVIPIEYRYVIVDAFLSFVAGQHKEEIDLYIRNIGEEDFHGN